MDVYKIGIEMSLLGGIENALNSLGGKFNNLDKSVQAINKRLSATHDILKGIAGIGISFAVLDGMAKVVDKGRELVRLQNNMTEAGASAADVAAATAKSWEATSKYMSVSVNTAMKFGNDFRGIFGDQKDANGFIGVAAGLDAFMMATKGSDAGHAGAEGIMKQVEAAVKSGEISNNITPGLMQTHLMRLAALQTGFGDSIDFNTYLRAQRQAGVSYRGMSDDMKYGVFPALVQEFGPGAGNMLMSSFQRIGAGTMWRGYAIQEGITDGLIDPSGVAFDKKGNPLRLKSGSAINQHSLAMTDQFAWATQVMGPALMSAAQRDLAKDRIKDPNLTLDQELISKLSRFLPDRNSAKDMAAFLFGDAKFQKDMAVSNAAFSKLTSSGGFDGYLGKSLDYQLQSFSAQWNNLLTSLGSPLVTDAAKGLSVINHSLNSISTALSAHPESVNLFGKFATEIGAVLGIWGVGKAGKGAFNLLTGKGSLTHSAMALDTSATMLQEAARALGAKGIPGLNGNPGKSPDINRPGLGPLGWNLLGTFYDLWNMSGDDVVSRVNSNLQAEKESSWRGLLDRWIHPTNPGPHPRNSSRHDMAYYNEHGLPAGRPPTPIHFSPTMTAQVMVDGRAVAGAIAHLVMDGIKGLISHPTSAPMSNSTQYAPSFDGGASGH